MIINIIELFLSLWIRIRIRNTVLRKNKFLSRNYIQHGRLWIQVTKFFEPDPYPIRIILIGIRNSVILGTTFIKKYCKKPDISLAEY